jgi:hypothetical protein
MFINRNRRDHLTFAALWLIDQILLILEEGHASEDQTQPKEFNVG